MSVSKKAIQAAAGVGGFGPSTYAIIGGADSSYGVALIDISDPTSPSIADTLTLNAGGFDRNIQGLAFANDDQYILAGGTGGYSFLVDHTTAGSISNADNHTSASSVYRSDFDPTDRWIIAPDNQSSSNVKVFDHATKGTLGGPTIYSGGGGAGRQISFHPDGDLFIFAADGSEGGIKMFDFNVSTGVASAVSTMTDGRYALSDTNGAAFSPDGNYIACARDSSNAIVILDATTKGGALSEADTYNPSQTAFEVSWSPDGAYLAVGCGDLFLFSHDGAGTITLEDTKTDISGTGAVFGVNFTADGKYIVVATNGSPYFSIVDHTTAGTLGTSYSVTVSGITEGRAVAASHF